VYGNTATDSGGGIFNEGGTLTLHNSSSVHDNMGGFAAGGILNLFGGSATLEDTSSVYNNSTAELSVAAIRAAIKIKPKILLSGSVGGGITNDDGATLMLEDSSTVHDNGASVGGGIANGFDSDSTLIVQDKASVYNNVGAAGGGIANFSLFETGKSGVTLDGMTILGAATIHHNLGDFGGGIYNNGDMLMRNTSSDYSNHAFDQGGGIYNTGAAVLAVSGIKSKIIRPRQSICLNNLGVCTGSVILRDFSTVHDNVADFDGGGIYNLDTTSFRFSVKAGPVFKALVAPTGVFLEGGSSVYNNSSGVPGPNSGGGGVSNVDATFGMFDDSSVHDNSAIFDGGGVFGDFSNLFMEDRSTIYRNTALGGGGIYDVDSNVVLDSHATVHDNTATGTATVAGLCCGGGIANVGDVFFSSLFVDNYAAIYHNSAYDGAGIYNTGGSTVELNNLTSVDHNIASDVGGGVYTSGTCASQSATVGCVTMNDTSSISYNSAGLDGGGVSTTNSSVAMNNGSSIHHNTAAHNGGGINATNISTVTLNDASTIKINKAGTDGGGIFDDGSGNTITTWSPTLAVTANTPDNIS
jgi:predicted outer membrane repeat protein